MFKIYYEISSNTTHYIGKSSSLQLMHKFLFVSHVISIHSRFKSYFPGVLINSMLSILFFILVTWEEKNKIGHCHTNILMTVTYGDDCRLIPTQELL